MKKSTKDFFIVGFALFAMFFGAGNLIFPPLLGHAVGKDFIFAIIGFTLTGIGLPLLAIIACTKGDGTLQTMASKVSPKFAIIFTSILFIAIGPMLGIPRTAATTYELTIQPILPNISPIVWMIIYFGVNLYFVFSKSSIIDTIGKFLTPILLIILGVIIFKGVFLPIGNVIDTGYTNVFSSSLIEGYQTLDALGSLLFAAIVSKSFKDKGYDKKKLLPMTIKASLVAAVGLAIVYGGLTFIGAQTTAITAGDISNTQLLLLISQRILGSAGTTIIGVAMCLACLTTSISLITAGASFFEKVSSGKFKYKFNAVIIALISIFIGQLGVDNIIKFSVPVLNILYPVAITLILTTLLDKYIKNKLAIKLGVYTSLIFGFLQIIPSIDLSFIPLNNFGFAWLCPTIIIILLGLLVFKKPNLELIEV